MFSMNNVYSKDNIINIPDKNFKIKLLEIGIDLNNNKEIEKSEAMQVKYFHNLCGLGIRSLVGIEDFENLLILNCSNNEINYLDLSKNLKLQELYCSENKLNIIFLKNNIDLQILDCSSNYLQRLNVSNNSKLLQLICSYNFLRELIISQNNYSIEWLQCNYNHLFELDISSLKNLDYLDCSFCRLKH